MNKAWEYKQLLVNLTMKGVLSIGGKEYNFRGIEVTISEMGSEGWELVTITPVTTAEKHSFEDWSYSYTQALIYVFKREISK